MNPLFRDAQIDAASGLKVFAPFHLNLAFSSIEEARRDLVIPRCYWPLLRLAERRGPIGLEASGFTLEEIAARDPEWIARAREQHGITIHQIEGLDLRNDIDSTAALCAGLDLVLSAPTAAAAAAASVGAKVWFLTAGRTWPRLGADEYPWYADTRVLSPERFGDWDSLMPRAAAKLAGFAAE